MVKQKTVVKRPRGQKKACASQPTAAREPKPMTARELEEQKIQTCIEAYKTITNTVFDRDILLRVKPKMGGPNDPVAIRNGGQICALLSKYHDNYMKFVLSNESVKNYQGLVVANQIWR